MNNNRQTIYDKYSSLLHLLNEAHDSMVSLAPSNKDVKQYVDVFKDIGSLFGHLKPPRNQSPTTRPPVSVIIGTDSVAVGGKALGGAKIPR